MRTLQTRREEAVKNQELSYPPETPDLEIYRSLGAVINLFYKTWRIRLRVVFAVIMMAGMFAQCYGQGTTVFNCGVGGTAWTYGSSGSTCVVGRNPYSSTRPNFNGVNISSSSQVSAGSVQMAPANAGHAAWQLMYSQPVNDQAFSSTFTFVGNGYNLAFVLNNTYPASGTPGDNGDFPWYFNAGAGGEGGFYQNCCTFLEALPYNLFAVELDSYSPLNTNASFTHSSAQLYQSAQTPYIPLQTTNNYLTNKVSTSPVPLNNPSGTPASPSTDTFSATITYTGNNVTLALYDVTAGGTCSPITSSTCFSYTWQGINIPGIVGGPWIWNGGGSLAPPSGQSTTTAYPGFTAGTNLNGPAEQIFSFQYATLSPASTPTFSPAGGTYSSTQSVTISDSSSGSAICYSLTGPPTTDGYGHCLNGGTLYSGAVSVAAGQTIYAVAGAGSSDYGDSLTGSATYTITGTIAQPTINPPTGTYQGNQTVYLAAPSGPIYYNTSGSPNCSSTLYSSPITVSSNEAIYAVACPSSTPSAVSSAAYVISPFSGNSAPVPAASPVMSPVPGTYPGTQTVSLSSTTSNSYICYSLLSSIPTPATYLLPQPNNGATYGVGSGSPSCNTGTLYTGPITVSSSQTVYAITGVNGFAAMPSSLVKGSYTIGTSTPVPGTPTNPKATAVPSS